MLSGLSLPDSLALLEKRLLHRPVSNLISTMMRIVVRFSDLRAGVPLHLKFCANLLVDGLSMSEAVEMIKGAKGISLLEFSFDSSLNSLSQEAVALSYFLAVKKQPARRSEMVSAVRGDEELFTQIHNRLLQISFVERTAEDKKQVRFQISSPLLREHLLKRGPEILGPIESKRILSLANVRAETVGSTRVSFEIDRALHNATSASVGRNWEAGIAVLEQAARDWGEDGRLLAQQGYYYYRLERLGVAHDLLQRAINTRGRVCGRILSFGVGAAV